MKYTKVVSINQVRVVLTRLTISGQGKATILETRGDKDK